jgi:myosin-5
MIRAHCAAENHTPKPIVQALYKQLFSFVNLMLFNQLMLRRGCCSLSNGEYMKAGLAQVCDWFANSILYGAASLCMATP